MLSHPSITVILLAGGIGSRMQTSIPKQFLMLQGIPLAMYSYSVFASLPEVKEIIVVCEPQHRHYFGDHNLFAPPGKRRQDSVFSGFKAINTTPDFVCVHDAARPFIDQPMIRRLLEAAEEYGAAAVGMPVKFTVKQCNSDHLVQSTPDRSFIWEVQTPQVARPHLLQQGFEFAHEHNLPVTDDVSLIELLNKPVKLVEGSYMNLKITTPDDFSYAEHLIAKHSSEVQLESKYKIEIAYDGTQYGGWQIQPNSPTIQQTLQESLTTILRQPIQVTGSGRTDAGVHALGQIAHFTSTNELDLQRFLPSANGILPHDIRILTIEPTAPGFHARISATSKTYYYHLYLDRVLDPFRRLYVTHVWDQLDLEILKQAALLFVGTHDFTSFSNEAHKGSAARNAIRTLTRLDIVREEGGYRLEFQANGFLYKMVRNIVGLLLSVASGKRSIAEIPEVFAAKDRRKACMAAPAQGLFLVRVEYPML